MKLKHLLPGVSIVDVSIVGVLIVAVLIVLPAIYASARPVRQTGPAATPQGSVQQRAAEPPRTQTGVAGNAQAQEEGERVFQQNCSRCHTAPDGFSPRISGTVALHMRVRASLSEHDEKELLRFLNP